MFLAEAGYLFMGFILSLSGIQGKPNTICALKGSSVNLPCSPKRPTASTNWYTVYGVPGGSKIEPSADETPGKYSMSADGSFNLTINSLTERDENVYCCRDTDDKCQQSGIHLHVAELQVKVIPATEGQTVTLMCSSSCPLTEKPAAYIWYKNREFLYEDWSPWYQELLSSEEAVTYSCAVKGYEHLRAPEVSVDSITATCFSVTSAKGRMCSSQQTSVDESCTITYPREIQVERTPDVPDHTRLTCNSSCLQTAALRSFVLYKNRNTDAQNDKQNIMVPNTSADTFSCAVKGVEYLRSADICVMNENCWSLNYVHSRICALEGSSVNISSKYSHPDYGQIKSKCWYKVKGNAEEEGEPLHENADQVEYDDSMKNQHILTLKRLKKDDSAEYRFTIKTQNEEWKENGREVPGVALIVTELRVEMSPSAAVTEGQRVTLTCRTSCPLTDNKNYIWFLNSRPLTPRETQTKHLILDPVSRENAGNYSCAVKTNKDISSVPKTLTVQSITGTWTPAAAGGSAALLVLILLTVFCWIRKKRISRQSSRSEIVDTMEQLDFGPEYDTISAQPAEPEHNYTEINFSKSQTESTHSTAQPFQPQEQDHVPYIVVNFRNNTTPELNDQAVDI